MTAHHDIGYRLLFAHPELVRELIAGFTPFKLFDSIALSSFKRINATYVSERESLRESDMVWRVQAGERMLYVYILLEFQSRVDRWMALRMQTYIALLHQDLIKPTKCRAVCCCRRCCHWFFTTASDAGAPAWSWPIWWRKRLRA